MSERKFSEPVVLTIAGFDPSGAAGIIADVRTIQSFRCLPVAAVTSVTFQNSENYFGAVHQTAGSVRAQVEAIVGEYEIAAVKIGMLPTAQIVTEVARLTSQLDLPAPVVDPVMQSTTGGELMGDDAFQALVRKLLPLTGLLTPNIPEAERLAGMPIVDEVTMRDAAGRIRELGVRAVLIKAGHLDEANPATRFEANDLLHDGKIAMFRGSRIAGAKLRGSGCILSSAIAAGLAKGVSLENSIQAARDFVTSALAATPDLAVERAGPA